MATSDFSNIGLYNFMFYASFCILFMILILFYSEKISHPITMFVILSYILQVALNTAASSNKLVCDATSPGSAIFFTLVPWLFILGVGNAALYYFPGWLRIFANSFGMYFAYQLKPEDFRIPVEGEDRPNSNPGSGLPGPIVSNMTEEYAKLYNKLLIDPKKIINEVDFIGKTDKQILEIYKLLIPINPTIFGNLQETPDPAPGPTDTKNTIFIPEIKTKIPNTDKNSPIQVIDGPTIPAVKISNRAFNIIKTIKKKNRIGFLIWNILLGMVASMVSTNSLINSGCKINLL
jgi:hypothetical protein